MDFGLLIGMYVLGMVAGALVVMCWVPDKEVKRYADETENGVWRVK